MIEATCGACGTIARIAETDVPVGAKFVTCASCKARVPLPQQGAAAPKASAKAVAIPPTPRTPPPIPSAKPGVDLADLPAPKRTSPLGSAPPRPPLGAGADLPAPKGAKPSAPSALDLDDLMGAELPAPKGKSDAGLADLPAPRTRASALGDVPASRPVPSALADLPAPKAKPSALADLPAPKAKPSALADLPAPKKSGASVGDLPAPKAKAARGAPLLDDDLDLPMSTGSGGYTDLPMPKPGANNDLPMPKPGANNDLPAPKGFFDDLPQPAKKSSQGSAIDLPAPKGFFDDLPQPAMGNAKTVDLPAPKGFFDDLPQPATSNAKSADLPAPKGFFDDLPQPSRPAGKDNAGGAAPAGGLFDDLAPSGKGGPDDIGFGDLDLGPGGDSPLELDGGPSASRNAGPELDLGLPLAEGPDFTELDLSEPTAKGSVKPLAPLPPDPNEGSPIKIKTPKGGKPATPIAINVKKDGPADLKLDLADDPHEGKPGAAAQGKVPAKRKGPTPEEAAEDRVRKRKRTRIVLASVLGLALAGAGGFYGWQKHTAKQERAEKINTALDTARKALTTADWTRAAGAANEVLEVEPNNVAALGLGAEAAIAGALDNGINYDNRIQHGRNLAQRGIGVGATSKELERAKALMAIAAGQADRAIPLLQQQIGAEPRNGWLQLYMGWAQLVKGDAAAAQSAFEQAVALAAATKLPALYGHGQAKLMKADLEAAKSDFATVLETAKDHIGAQVGLAATLPPQQSAQREADLLGVLARSDLDKADPRAVVRAWTLAADVARNGGRLDIARERYRKATSISAFDLAALTGLASVELADGKIQIARDLLQKALTAKPDDAEAQLLDASADILEGKLPDAEAKLAKLAEREPPLPTLQLARLHVAKGRLLEKQGKSEEAIAEYTEGAKLAGDIDLTPTMAAVTMLTELARKAPDEATAIGYRSRADQLLSALAEKAKEDGEVAMTLGVAYLQAGDANKAEDFLRRSVALREKDPESRLQLARALSVLGRTDDAIASLKEALAIDPKRGDVALELARTYQNAGRHDEAVAAYEKLLAEQGVPSIVRVNAGRYFASRGAFDKAAAQSGPILAVEPDNAGGLYLKGEGLILAKKWDEARTVLTRATDLDTTDAQALDALGRAFDGSLAATDDTKFIEGARHAYDRASKADPKMFHPHLGLGRALVRQFHWDEAVAALAKASAIDKSHSGVAYAMGLAYFGQRTKSPLYKKNAADWLVQAVNGRPELSDDEKADAYWRMAQAYDELGNKGPQAAAAYETATKLAENLERNTGKAPPWLTEALYTLGDIYGKLNSGSQQKRAWTRFLDRKPSPSIRVTTATRWMASSGQRF